jgi:mono/diheme cytochrome c family protein
VECGSLVPLWALQLVQSKPKLRQAVALQRNQSEALPESDRTPMRTKLTSALLVVHWLLLGVAGMSQPLLAADLSNEVSFAREVLPILSNKCFVCHGPDGKEDVELRLDSFDAATSDLGGYRAIDPDAPGKSELLARIHSRDDPMPPADSGKALTPDERDRLSRWVRQGGQYAQHWAFVPPRKSLPPDSASIGKSDSIDTFVLAQLKKRKLEFAPEASREILARRAALALTGLPPEPNQLSRFLRDDNSNAYERFIDELLMSDRYGEHQARYWLDAVRYGDTHGLHLDNRRGIYPYRDWVVRSFNENLPLDDFITWQVAGDLLPQPTLEQRVATGFVRMNPTTGEGGAIPEEFQCKNNFDRTEMLGTVLLGMTLTCARCHTHKYDPIHQEEYYRLLAFFNSTAEPSMDGNSYTYGPVTGAPRDQRAWAEWDGIAEDRDRLLAEVASQATALGPALTRYATKQSQWSTDEWKVTQPVDSTASAPEDSNWQPIKKLPGKSDIRLPKSGQSLWVAFRLNVPSEQTLWISMVGGPESTLEIDGRPASIAIDVQQRSWRGGLPIVVSGGEHRLRAKVAGSDDRSMLELRVASAWQDQATSAEWGACGRREQLLMVADEQGPFTDISKKRARAITTRLLDSESRFTTTLVAQDLPEARATQILTRGEYNRPIGDSLNVGTPSVMGSLPDGAPRNRLGLAQWLTRREHPLVSRVLVNRIWQRTFGDGLVRTPEDFGLQGQQPTHPQLLDWLAVELHETGWDLKQMLRLLVTSRTFRQSSAWRGDTDDPENRLWARGPRYRLDAEVLRDIGLWASGLLDPHMGGEGVKPYQPDGMWLALAHPASNTKRYVPDTGKRLYRRSLYVYWKRTSPHPMMTLFDAPDRESSCVQRSRTNTSLQSLGLLNENQRIEMSRALAARLLRENEDDAARLNQLFSLLACRQPNDREKAACLTLLRTSRARFAGKPDDAAALLAADEADRDNALEPVEHASWIQVTATVLASDVAILMY